MAGEPAAVQLDLLSSALELSEESAAALHTGIRIEHTYPAAREFLRRHGPETVAVLHDLLSQAELRGGELVVSASMRDIAGRLGFISKDTVHRRLRQLVRAGVLRRPASAARPGTSMSSMFEIELAGTAISVTAVGFAVTSGRPGPEPAPAPPPLPTPSSPSSSSTPTSPSSLLHPSTRSTPTPPPTRPPLPPPVSTTDRRVHSCASRAGAEVPVEDPWPLMRDGQR